jgi:hypothetical protein
VKNSVRLVAGDLLHDRPSNAEPHQVAHGRAPQEQAPEYRRPAFRQPPCLPEPSNLNSAIAAIQTETDVGAARHALRELPNEQAQEWRRDRNRPARAEFDLWDARFLEAVQVEMVLARGLHSSAQS